MNSIGENWFTVIISKDNVKKDCSACKIWQRNFARRNAALVSTITILKNDTIENYTKIGV